MTILTLAALSAVPGCGGGDDDADEPGIGEPSAVSAAPTVAAASQHFSTDFEPVCRGTGAEFATPYDPAVAGVHPTLMLQGADVDDLVESTAGLNPEWTVMFDATADAYAEVELVVCSVRTAAVLTQTCTGYQDEGVDTGNTVDLYAATYAVTVRVARTAEVLAETTVDTPGDECPMFVMFTEGESSTEWYDEDGQAVIDFVKPFAAT